MTVVSSGYPSPYLHSSWAPYVYDCTGNRSRLAPIDRRPWRLAEREEKFQIGSQLYGQISHGDHFLRMSGLGYPVLTAAAAAGCEVATNSVPLAAFAGAAVEFAQRYRRLEEDERAVFALLDRLAFGGSKYKVWIDHDDLVKAMDPELDIDDRRRLLARMKSRGLLEEGAGKWRAVW
jgi:hypothetical protein